ncbi:MAG: hypothetical protein F6K22_33560 [Okeania sp. SIO2F4]|uniref:hypothetical protein n=1 Tax=Okeania sp. SIO2F4 TaxID=2607790 RepID=UPI001429D955|nr:hypothetical protein [Okeania sp. SIO2F4]NES07292.1 hypothetical protein [Okeania sp. SIO2F4]
MSALFASTAIYAELKLLKVPPSFLSASIITGVGVGVKDKLSLLKKILLASPSTRPELRLNCPFNATALAVVAAAKAKGIAAIEATI